MISILCGLAGAAIGFRVGFFFGRSDKQSAAPSTTTTRP
jgi:hypothetical protein